MCSTGGVRWEHQKAGEQALLELDGLVRSVRSPEFDGVTFHEVHARSVLNKVPGGSPMPFKWTVNPYRGCSHACTYCLAGDTRILMADGRTRALAELRVGDEVYGTEGAGTDRRFRRTQVLAHWSTVKPAYRVALEDGTELVASGDHRFLSASGWKHVIGTSGWGTAERPHLVPGLELVGTGSFAAGPQDTVDYRAGYLCGMLRPDKYGRERDASDRALSYLPAFTIGTDFAKLLPSPELAWQQGFLAGVYDAAGGWELDVLRIVHEVPQVVDTVCDALARFGFTYTVKKHDRDRSMLVVRLSGGLAEQLRFLHTVDPAVARKRALEPLTMGGEFLRVQSIEPLGLDMPLFDITTGTGDFIANGMVTHNCFARNTHTYLDFDAGKDFDTQVVVKVNAPEVLSAQLRRPGWAGEHVAMGTNTDPYQRAEGRYELMPRIITALAETGTPFSILTKGTVLARDLPLLGSVARDVPVGLGVSIALLDQRLQRRLEPGTPSPQARLDLVRKARAAGLPCGVFLAPILPGLTDSVEALDVLLAAVADAGASGVTVLPLHLRPGAREWFARWLATEHSELVPRYRSLYARGSYVNKAYREWLSERIEPLIRHHDLEPSSRRRSRGVPGDESVSWPEGAIPAPRDPGTGAVFAAGEQLTLL
ncbi:intein-containing Rv2578c family radical SAM protein [Amycolatopsis sp. NPDC059657]|uniref:intein-containing Rv2578c family radical SAM protein n=1 Tax=Amycolatopsis sp. NPDC059657 TaxID=3346899 RepID=UPI003671DC21